MSDYRGDPGGRRGHGGADRGRRGYGGADRGGRGSDGEDGGGRGYDVENRGGRGYGGADRGGRGYDGENRGGRGHRGGRQTGEDYNGGRGREAGGYRGRTGGGRGEEGNGSRGRGRRAYGDGGFNGGRRSQEPQPLCLPPLTEMKWMEAAGPLYDKCRRDRPTMTATEPPERPGFGSIGEKFRVRANHFLVKASGLNFYHYDVTITPEVTLKKYSREIISHLFRIYGKSELQNRLPAYDGCKSLYTAGALPFKQSKEFLVKVTKEGESGSRRRELEFKVVLKFVAMRTLQTLMEFISGRPSDSTQEIIQALDIVMRSTQSLNRLTPVGRSFFSEDLGDGFLGKGIVYWRGFYQSIRPTQMGLSLNIDASATAFYEKTNVASFVEKQLRSLTPTTRLSNEDRLKLIKVLKGLRVRTVHCGNRDYKVTGLSILPSDEEKFSLNGVEKTVAQYFREKYGFTLRYPSLPCLKCGSSKKPVSLPMEVCNILEGQKYSRKLDMQQVTALLRATCQRPYERRQTINKMVKDTNYNADELVNREFKLQVADEFTTIEARVLPPPMLNYGSNTSIAPNLGTWNMIDNQMYQGGSVNNWRCINFSLSAIRELRNFCSELADICLSKGMNFAPNPTHAPKTFRPELVETALEEVYVNSVSEKKLTDLLLIILPDGDTQYGKIKRICETKLGIVSQCFKPQNVVSNHRRTQYLANIALKINVKAGGCNAVLKDTIGRKIPVVTDRRTIVFGADVTHPSLGEDSGPSIAAVVASMDFPEIAKYKGSISAQPHRQEIIQDLSGMVSELLVSFAKVNGGELPESIIFYRDGVSEGQFAEVLQFEMGAIRTACQSIKKDYLPYVTFIVVQKRHHTRLFPADEKMQDRNGNVLPGTVVDTQICHPSQYDFYLCSHAGIQGTSRPAHYHVLFDENHFAPDLLQLFTYSLCYTFARCTRSVSVVPAAYYAHLLAFRARYYIDPDRSDEGSSRSGGQGSQANDNAIAGVLLPSIKGNVQEVMFYC